MDLFDYKPKLDGMFRADLPASVRMGQRLTTMTSRQESFPIAPSRFRFAQHGESGAWVSELMPHAAEVVDDLCFVKSMYTEAINHDPAITFFQTGAQLAGRPSIGAWLSYGLGSESRDLPGFVVMVSQGRCKSRAASIRPAVGQWLSAHPVSGSQVPIGRGSRSSPFQPRGTQGSDAPPDLGRPGRAQRLKLDASETPRSPPYRSIRN